MLTQKSSPAGAAPASSGPAPAAASASSSPPADAPAAAKTDAHTASQSAAARDLENAICYFEGNFVPMRDAKVGIMTHAFMYGTATFEGIRAYWNEDQGKLYGLKIREHVERIRQSCRILLMENVPSVDELTRLIVETVRRNGFREDAYIRPSFYKSTKAIGVRLHHLENELYIIAIPFGNYVDTEAGIRVMTSTWRRNADEALPARGKIVGGYVNMAFQKSEAELNGYDEAVVLTADGHVNEASAANLFIVRDGVALTPPVNDDLLEGVTRKAMLELLANEHVPIEVRSLDRSELYVCDEMFLCGTGVQISPVIEIDHRPVGSGEIGPVARLVRDRYFDAVRGRLPEYQHWLTEIPAD
jgi:branched-chain amino acid aminotransferase